jgi:hypothetical protein
MDILLYTLPHGIFFRSIHRWQRLVYLFFRAALDVSY